MSSGIAFPDRLQDLSDVAAGTPATGDLFVFDATTGKYTKLAVSTDGYAIIADSTQATGLRYAAISGAGIVTAVTQANGLTLTSGTLAFSGSGYDSAGAAAGAETAAKSYADSLATNYDAAGAAASALSAAVSYAAGAAGTAQTNAEAASLALTGGTMSGAIAMGSHKITGMANGSGAQDAAAFGQIPTALPPNGSAGGSLTGSYPNPGVATLNQDTTGNAATATALSTSGTGTQVWGMSSGSQEWIDQSGGGGGSSGPAGTVNTSDGSGGWTDGANPVNVDPVTGLATIQNVETNSVRIGTAILENSFNNQDLSITNGVSGGAYLRLLPYMGTCFFDNYIGTSTIFRFLTAGASSVYTWLSVASPGTATFSYPVIVNDTLTVTGPGNTSGDVIANFKNLAGTSALALLGNGKLTTIGGTVLDDGDGDMFLAANLSMQGNQLSLFGGTLAMYNAGGSGGGNIVMDAGTLENVGGYDMAPAVITGTPTNTVTPAAWEEVTSGASTYWRPLYQ